MSLKQSATNVRELDNCTNRAFCKIFGIGVTNEETNITVVTNIGLSRIYDLIEARMSNFMDQLTENGSYAVLLIVSTVV